MAEEVRELSKDKLHEILQVSKVDVGNGTLFGTARRRKPRDSSLTLVISTGGSGFSSIKEAIRIADQKLEKNYTDFVKFIIVDSDTGELDTVGEDGKVQKLNISTPGAKARMVLEARPERHRRFLPANYNVGLINDDGSSQDRSTGKLKLYDRNRSGSATNDQDLAAMVSNLFETDWKSLKDRRVDIVVLSGLSGGNGSGTFLDIAALARSSCADPSKVSVYGFFMLPDTAERFASNQDAKISLYANGFAALKELEGYMSIGFEPGRKEEFSFNNGRTYTVDQANKLYDYPILLSGDYDQAVSMVAETIVNMIAYNAGGFSMGSFYSNMDVARNNIFAAIGKQGYLTELDYPDDSHAYCGIGYSTASIPEKVVVPNAVSHICRRLYQSPVELGIPGATSNSSFCTKEKHLTRMEFIQSLKKLLSIETENFDKLSLWRKLEGTIDSEIRFEENDYEVTWQDIVRGDVADFLAGYHQQAVADHAVEELQKIIADWYRAFEEQAKFIMREFGPRGMEYLYTGEGDLDENGNQDSMKDICLKTQLENVLTQLSVVAGKVAVYPGTEEQGGWITTIGEALFKKKTADWVQQVTDAAVVDVKNRIAKLLQGNNGIFKREYDNRVVLFYTSCRRFADVLEGMTTAYTSAGMSLDAATYNQFAQNAGETNSVNLCSNPSMYNWVVESVNMKVNSVQIDDVKEALVNDFYAHRNDWISEVNGVARKRYDTVMSEVCKIGSYATQNNGLNLSIEDYFDKVLADVVGEAQQKEMVSTTVKGIVDRLMVNSRPSIKIKPATSNTTPPTVNVTIMLPQGLVNSSYGSMIDEAFQKEKGRTLGNANVVYSDAVDVIVCYQTSVGNALSDLDNLDIWEDAYDRSKSNTIHTVNGEYDTKYSEIDRRTRDQRKNISEPNLTDQDNMLATTGLSWRHYPTINLSRYGNNFYTFPSGGLAGTTEARYRNEVFAQKIDYALRERLIEVVQDGTNYKYYLNLIPEDWTNLSIAGYEETLEKGQKLFELLKNQNPFSGSGYRKQICLIGSQFFDVGGIDFEKLLRLQPGQWPQERIDTLHKSYMMRIMRKNVSLYSQMEETIDRYYPIRVAYDEWYARQKAFFMAKKFTDLYAYNVIKANANRSSWTLQINAAGGILSIKEFTPLALAQMKDFEKALLKDKLSIVMVVNDFINLMESGRVNENALETVKQKYAQNAQVVVETAAANKAVLENYLTAYDGVCAALEDPIDQITSLLKRYGMKETEENQKLAENAIQIMAGIKQGLEDLIIAYNTDDMVF